MICVNPSSCEINIVEPRHLELKSVSLGFAFSFIHLLYVQLSQTPPFLELFFVSLEGSR